MLRGNYSDAQDIFLNLLSDDPDNELVLYHLGLCNFSFEKFEDAAVYLGRCIEVNASNIDAWVDLGDVYVAMDETDQAKMCFEQALSLDAANARATVSYARFFDYMEMNEEAVVWYEKSLGLCDPLDAPRFELAIVYGKVERYLEADIILEGLITESLRRGTQYFVGEWQAGSREDLAAFIQDMREEREENARMFEATHRFPIEYGIIMYKAIALLIPMSLAERSQLVQEIVALKLVGLEKTGTRSHYRLNTIKGAHAGLFLHCVHAVIASELWLDESVAPDMHPAYVVARKLFNHAS